MSNPLALPVAMRPWPSAAVSGLGRTVVVAPHADDESLGCGGLIALLRAARVPVAVILVSDGTMSHPHSRKYPATARRALRDAEFHAALDILGVKAEATLLLGLPDGAVPSLGAPGFAEGALAMSAFFRVWAPATVLVPWRRDPHPDHRATSQLVQAALPQLAVRPRVLEYLVWTWERAATLDLPRADEVTGWHLDIGSVLEQKQQAIAAHRSQISGLIDDDPTGFQLSAQMLAHFAQPYELYLEAKPATPDESTP